MTVTYTLAKDKFQVTLPGNLKDNLLSSVPHQDMPLFNAADPGNWDQKDILQAFQRLPCLALLHLALRTTQMQ